MTRFTALVSLVLLSTACNPPGYISKSDGDDIRIQSGAFIPVNDQAGNIVSAVVVLSDKPDLCRSMRSSRMPRRLEGLNLQLFRFSDRALLAPDTGEYSVITSEPTRAGSYAAGGFVKLDANCNNTLLANDAVLRSGFIEIDQLETGRDGFISGTLDVTYGNGEDARGRFTAEWCEITVSQLNCQ